MQSSSSPAVRPTSLLALLTVAALAAACSANPTGQEVVDRSAQPICEKAKECAETSFAVSFPGGVDECVTKSKSEASKKLGSDLDKSSVCTDDELNKCVTDLKAAACPAGEALPTIPCKC